MRRLLALAGLVAALAVVGNAFAGEPGAKREKAKQEEGIGKFVSATLDAEKIAWKLSMEADGVEKTFDMAADVTVIYTEKNGQKHASSIAPTGKKAPEAKGTRLVATGKFVKAEFQGKQVAVTVKVADAEQVFLMPQRLGVRYTQQADKLVASRISTAPKPGAEKAKAAEPVPPNVK
jgi:hypothetical protein